MGECDLIVLNVETVNVSDQAGQWRQTSKKEKGRSDGFSLFQV